MYNLFLFDSVDVYKKEAAKNCVLQHFTHQFVSVACWVRHSLPCGCVSIAQVYTSLYIASLTSQGLGPALAAGVFYFHGNVWELTILEHVMLVGMAVALIPSTLYFLFDDRLALGAESEGLLETLRKRRSESRGSSLDQGGSRRSSISSLYHGGARRRSSGGAGAADAGFCASAVDNVEDRISRMDAAAWRKSSSEQHASDGSFISSPEAGMGHRTGAPAVHSPGLAASDAVHSNGGSRPGNAAAATPDLIDLESTSSSQGQSSEGAAHQGSSVTDVAPLNDGPQEAAAAAGPVPPPPAALAPENAPDGAPGELREVVIALNLPDGGPNPPNTSEQLLSGADAHSRVHVVCSGHQEANGQVAGGDCDILPCRKPSTAGPGNDAAGKVRQQYSRGGAPDSSPNAKPARPRSTRQAPRASRQRPENVKRWGFLTLAWTPGVLALSDCISGLASGMTVKFFPIFFKDKVRLTSRLRLSLRWRTIG